MSGSPIITLTLNPALDVSSAVDVVVPEHKLRCDRARFEPGGGGVNVARVCQRLGEDALAVVPVGGTVGAKIGQLLDSESLPWRPVEVAEETRQSISITESSSGHQYRFVLPGPGLSPAELDACCAAVVEASAGARCVVLSGSMPRDADPEVVSRLVTQLADVAVIVDTSGPALEVAMRSGAYLVKPSARELAALVDRTLDTEDDVERAALELIAESNVEVLVASIGAGGAIAATADGGTFRFRAPAVKVRSAVGAGDSMVAGLAVGVQRELAIEEAVALGVAAGTAAVLTDGTELCTVHDVERLLPRVAR